MYIFLIYIYIYVYILMSHPLTSVSLSPVQICRKCWSLLWNACRQEETYISEEEGGTTIDSLSVFLCHSHLSFQHRTHVFVPYYLLISPSSNASSLHREELLAIQSTRLCYLGSYTTTVLTQYSQSTLSAPSSHHIPLIQRLSELTKVSQTMFTLIWVI